MSSHRSIDSPARSHQLTSVLNNPPAICSSRAEPGLCPLLKQSRFVTVIVKEVLSPADAYPPATTSLDTRVRSLRQSRWDRIQMKPSCSFLSPREIHEAVANPLVRAESCSPSPHSGANIANSRLGDVLNRRLCFKLQQNRRFQVYAIFSLNVPFLCNWTGTKSGQLSPCVIVTAAGLIPSFYVVNFLNPRVSLKMGASMT